MSLYVSALTFVHTVLSFIAIGLGIVATARLLGADTAPRWTRYFFATAAAVTLTGFIFPFTGVTPAFATGIVSTVILIAWLVARYSFQLAGVWRSIYALSIVASLYLLIFVTIAQAFQKIPALSALAPTQSEAPFAVAQVIALVLFAALGVAAVRRFRPLSAATA
ncbi:MAG: hypothetical protein AB7F09_15180 [Parvibaculaceae bacterium]